MSSFSKEPIQGLIEYIHEIKPYHTKLLDVFVQYLYQEDLKVTMSERLQIDIGLGFTEIISPLIHIDLPTSPVVNPLIGDRYRDASTGYLYEWNGTAWVAVNDPTDNLAGIELKEQIAFSVDVLDLTDNMFVHITEPQDPGYDVGGYGTEWDGNDGPIVTVDPTP